GNVVVISGNNARKTNYIESSIQAGLNVLADKPMAITPDNFKTLEQLFPSAKEKGVLLYDIMTERYEITTMMQKALSQMPEVFGTLEKGSVDNPAITKESVHHFFKYVSGQALIRPAWFFDVKQQGEGIVDIATHLVDLVFWECFPNEIIQYDDLAILEARRWATELSQAQFQKVTGLPDFPDYLQEDTKEGVLHTYSNGEINFSVKDVHAKVSVIWNYQAPEGAADTHYSIMRGTKANLVIRQGTEQNYKPVLYVEPVNAEDETVLEASLSKAIEKIGMKFSGLSFKK
ncbi:MAG: putative oxidoreductase C-terminal domain-containing protein, partial [Bacteroidota bacterium]